MKHTKSKLATPITEDHSQNVMFLILSVVLEPCPKKFIAQSRKEGVFNNNHHIMSTLAKKLSNKIERKKARQIFFDSLALCFLRRSLLPVSASPHLNVIDFKRKVKYHANDVRSIHVLCSFLMSLSVWFVLTVTKLSS